MIHRLVEFRLGTSTRGKIFLINGGPDLVSATHCQWHEDDGDSHSPAGGKRLHKWIAAVEADDQPDLHSFAIA